MVLVRAPMCSSWATIPIGMGYCVDLQAILSFDWLDGASPVLVGDPVRVPYFWSGMSGLKATVRTAILWGIVCGVLWLMWHQFCDQLEGLVFIPGFAPVDVKIAGTTVPGGQQSAQVTRWVLLTALLLAMVPSIFAALVGTMLAYTSYGTIADAVTVVSSGGPTPLVTAASDIAGVFWCINRWFPAVEFFVLTLNSLAVEIIMRVYGTGILWSLKLLFS